jgi:hypothetical protein
MGGMMKKIVIIGISTAFLLAGCVTTQGSNGSSNVVATAPPKDCNYDSTQGKEFVFRKQSPSIQKYGYQSWKKSPDIGGEKLSYSGYVDKRGKVKEQLVTG